MPETALELRREIVTFLLTDIEGSTVLWEDHPQAMSAALARHDAIASDVVAANAGTLIKTRGEGDSTFSVFRHPASAARAARDLQIALSEEPWPEPLAIRVRVALHTSEAELRAGDYYGPAVNRCARLRAIAYGGQTICSEATVPQG